MRIVVKIGTSTLAYPTYRLNIRLVEELCKTLGDLKNAGHEIVIVSSGAIAVGTGKLMLTSRPKDIPTKQAAAAVGQCELMYTYDKQFAEYNHTVGQILLDNSDVKNEERHTNFKNTITRMLELGVIPIINENDTVSTEEIRIGDNDTLSAIVAASIKADILILLSDIDGLYTADPHKDPDAKLIPVVEEVTPEIIALASGSGSELGTGGMITKIHAAEICNAVGTDMVITNGKDLSVLYTLAEGGNVGTRFLGKKVK